MAAPLRPVRNEAGSHARSMLRAESAKADPVLWTDYQLLQNGHAIYLPAALCEKSDLGLMGALMRDLEAGSSSTKGMVNWSQHLKFENPEFSETFNGIVQRLSAAFDLDVYATRLNFYPDNSSWKPFHHDSHAYGGRNLREDFTVGVSLGAMRSLVFKHVASGHQFSFPQHNGDIFAFTTAVNKQFQHGVPKETSVRSGPRFSIIAWGRRRAISAFNGGVDEVGTRDIDEEYALHDHQSGSASSSATKGAPAPAKDGDDEKETSMSIAEVAKLVEDFVLREQVHQQKVQDRKSGADDKKKRSRIQGSWAQKDAGTATKSVNMQGSRAAGANASATFPPSQQPAATLPPGPAPASANAGQGAPRSERGSARRAAGPGASSRGGLTGGTRGRGFASMMGVRTPAFAGTLGHGGGDVERGESGDDAP